MPKFYYARLTEPAKMPPHGCIGCKAEEPIIEGCLKDSRDHQVAVIDLGTKFRPEYYLAYYCKGCFDNLVGENGE